MGSPVFAGFQTILVAYDASPQAERAVDVALSMAESLKAKVIILAVIVPPEPAAARAELNAVLDDMHERYETQLCSDSRTRHSKRRLNSKLISPLDTRRNRSCIGQIASRPALSL